MGLIWALLYNWFIDNHLSNRLLLYWNPTGLTCERYYLNHFFCMAELPFIVLVSPRMSSGPWITFWVSVSVPQFRVRQDSSSPSETVLFQGSHASANTRLASACMQNICFAWFCCVPFALWSCYYFCREAEVPFPAVEFPPWQTGSFEELVPFI